MLQLKLLEKTIKSLEKEQIPYMLTGSLVSSFQGKSYKKMISDAEVCK